MFNVNYSVILERDTSELTGVSYTGWAPVVVEVRSAVHQFS